MKQINLVDEILTLDVDNRSLCWMLMYEADLNFNNSDDIKRLAHDLAHLQSHVNPNGIATYFDNIEAPHLVEQALYTLKEIGSPNYPLIKEAFGKITIKDGLMNTDGYDDSEDWDKWNYDDSELLLAYIKKNLTRFNAPDKKSVNARKRRVLLIIDLLFGIFVSLNAIGEAKNLQAIILVGLISSCMLAIPLFIFYLFIRKK